jgi:integrase
MARKAKFADFPGVRELAGGKLVFRHPLIGQKALPADMDSEEFAAAYEALRLLVAVPADAKPVVKKPTFREAFTEWKKSPEWAAYDEKTIKGHERHAKAFLEAAYMPTTQATFAELEVDQAEAEILPLLRKHVASHKPHKAKRVVIAIRKIYAAAVENEWTLRNLGNDIVAPKLPPSVGAKPWPLDAIEQFERYHQPGTGARTAFALARFLGNRRGDVSKVRWDQLKTVRYIGEDGEPKVATVIEFMTSKNAKSGKNVAMTLVIRPELEIVLNALDRSKGDTILKTRSGNPFSEKSLTNQMAVWCDQANLPSGLTLHGLRKSYANEIAEGAADPFTLQKAMGHAHISTTQIYLKKMDATPSAFRAAEAAERRTAEIKKLNLLGK